MIISNWNAGTLERWNAIALSVSPALPSPRLSHHVGHLAQLLGSGQAEVPEGEPLGVGWPGERGIERAVGSADDVDEAPLVDVRVALLHDWHVCSLRPKEKWRDAFAYLHHATCQSVMGCILAFTRPVKASACLPLGCAADTSFQCPGRFSPPGGRGAEGYTFRNIL